MRIHKFKLEDHPNFKKSADYDQSKRVAIQTWFNLEEKIARLAEKNGQEQIQDLKQEEINKQAQQTVNSWMGGGFVPEKPVKQKEQQDEFCF